MADIDPLQLVLRWLHILSAVVAVGGAIFMRFVLMPSAATLPDPEHQKLRQQVRSRFSRLYMIAVALLLITGFYNFVAVEITAHKGQGQYHGVMGLKIVLAIVVFFIGSALLGSAAAFDGLRKKMPFWAAFNVLLALVVIGLAGVLRAIPDAGPGPFPATPAAAMSIPEAVPSP